MQRDSTMTNGASILKESPPPPGGDRSLFKDAFPPEDRGNGEEYFSVITIANKQKQKKQLERRETLNTLQSSRMIEEERKRGREAERRKEPEAT